jgi:murein DD-endopeptidase MepM/ murein hydrolase activator NlpD
MAMPIKGKPISTAYRKAGKHWSTGFHTGIDIACPTGSEVFAVQDGTVTGASWGRSYGTQIVIDQDAIEGATRIPGGWAIYAHLSKVLVKPGDKVKKGDKIGLSGNSGNSTGPHLHYEIRNQLKWTGGKDQNPMPFINL